MKLIGSKTEDDLRFELIESSRALFNDPENKRLLDAVKAHFPSLVTAHVLAWTPEQGEDIYRVLVDGDAVLGVELDRLNDDSTPIVEDIPMKSYSRGLSRPGRLKLAVAQDLAQKELVARKRR